MKFDGSISWLRFVLVVTLRSSFHMRHANLSNMSIGRYTSVTFDAVVDNTAVFLASSCHGGLEKSQTSNHIIISRL